MEHTAPPEREGSAVKALNVIRCLLAGIAVLLLAAAVAAGLSAGFAHPGAVACLAAAFVSAAAGAVLSVICKFSGRK